MSHGYNGYTRKWFSLLCGKPQEISQILQISQIISALEEKCSKAYRSVRNWYGLLSFALKVYFQDKRQQSIPLSVAKPLPTNIFLSAQISVISVISVRNKTKFSNS